MSRTEVTYMPEAIKANLDSRVTKHGNGYAIPLPKALVSCNVLELGKRYRVRIEEIPEEKSENGLPGIKTLKTTGLAEMEA